MKSRKEKTRGALTLIKIVISCTTFIRIQFNKNIKVLGIQV